jgi:RimK family alpha-L-glutamate ligase
MTFYYIHDDLGTTSNTTAKLLQLACEKIKIPCQRINPADFNELSFPRLGQDDLLYRISTSQQSAVLEKYLLLDKPTTFYSSYLRSISDIGIKSLLLQHSNVPIPTTIYSTNKDKKYLQACVDSLGGFPVILKASGGSHGVGVMKLDSIDSLSSVLDFVSQDSDVVLRQFIRAKSSARLIVLGKEVVDSIEYIVPKNDFRSNIGDDPIVRPQQFDTQVQEVAIKAVSALGLEFGGVDILLDEKGKPYVLEVNFPCFFPRCQLLTGTDISGKMIDYLVQKAIQASLPGPLK